MTRLLLGFTLVILATQAFGKNIKIEIVTDEGNCPYAVEPDDPCSAGSEDVCIMRGSPHFIMWKYKGSSRTKPDFRIEMKNSSDHAIFAGGCRESSKSINCQISKSAPNGSYAYSVVNAVCKHDPRIIIN